MERLSAMQVFVRVAELNSFTRAADSLGLPRPRATVAVRQLEAELGTQLLHRTTRRVRLTGDGEAAYERCRELLSGHDELGSMFRGEQALRGRLRVDMPGPVARNHVVPALPDFLARHPHLEIELGTSERFVDLVREGYDCVLRVGETGDSRLVARRIGRYRIVNCASPGYLQRHGTPRSLANLVDGHRLVHFVGTLGVRPPGFEYREGTRYRTLVMPGAVTVNDAQAYQAACLAGLGLIQAPASGVRHLLESGELVAVLPELEAEPMPVTLLYPQRRHLPARVRAFMDWIAEILAPHVET